MGEWFSGDESKEILQKLVYKFGEIFICLPEIVKLAKELRVDGKGMLKV